MELSALPMPLAWDPAPVDVETDGLARLRIVAPGHTDLFHNPGGAARINNGPRALGVPPDGDFQLSARVSVAFAQTYDAGTLIVWSGESRWAKLCFELSPQGEAMAVSVVTRELSDDANGFTVAPGQSLWLRVSRLGDAWAFHARLEPGEWSFVRHFALDGPAPAMVGLGAQSPLGEGCTVTFEDITFASERLADLRGGA